MKLPATFDAATRVWFRKALRRPRPFKSARIKRDHNKIVSYLRRRGITVATAVIADLWGKHFATTNGGVMQRHNVVVLGHHVEGDEKRLFLLLHEAGHMVQHRVGFDVRATRMVWRDGEYHDSDNVPARRKSETMAYLMGTALAEHLDIRIDKAAWRRFNWDAKH